MCRRVLEHGHIQITGLHRLLELLHGRAHALEAPEDVLRGVVDDLDDAEVEIEISQGVKVRLLRTMISDVRSKGEPVKE